MNQINPQISERVAIVETKVDAMIVCIESIKDSQKDIQSDVKDVHDCLDKTREEVMAELKNMNKITTEQHNELNTKVSDLEKFKTKSTYWLMGAVASLGWAAGHTGILNLFK
jgi:septation ring formation regulator EzrA